MTLKEFQLRYSTRNNQIMWFLGAGASASAGIKTAWDMIWEFKRKLYCVESGVRINQVQDLSSERVRRTIQQGLDATGKYPAEGADTEYSEYFERVYPTPRDRQSYINGIVSAGSPSYGHNVLTALMQCDKVRAVWTTNFDEMVEYAYNASSERNKLLVALKLEDSALAMHALNDSRWPLLVKIHGDYRSNRLKNTTEELRSQDGEMRHALVEACKRFGLAIVGYSGRDNSVMDALEEAIFNGKGYPPGLFWFVRSGSSVLPRVTDLITKAQASGIEAALVEVETFDELMDSLLVLEEQMPAGLENLLRQKRSPITDIPVTPPANGTWPVIRLNALLVDIFPTICRLVPCKIGGDKEVAAAVKASGTEVIALRTRAGVVAFGRDIDLRHAFSPYEMSDLEVHTLNPKKLAYDSQEQRLLYDALTRAFVRTGSVLLNQRHGEYLLVESSSENRELYEPLRMAIKDRQLCGTVPGTTRRWHEAVKLHLERRIGRLWLLLEPTVWLEKSPQTLSIGNEGDTSHTQTPEDILAKDFIRERQAARHNTQWNNVFDGWVQVLLPDKEAREFKAFGIGDGLDAVFVLRADATTSRRQPHTI
jgi:NAD-dependent SIR2 family protein deacetylase